MGESADRIESFYQISPESLQFLENLKKHHALPVSTLSPILNIHAERGILMNSGDSVEEIAERLSALRLLDNTQAQVKPSIDIVDFYYKSGIPGISARQRMEFDGDLVLLKHIFADIRHRPSIQWTHGVFQTMARPENFVIIRHEPTEKERHLRQRHFRNAQSQTFHDDRIITHIVHKRKIDVTFGDLYSVKDMQQKVKHQEVKVVLPFIDVSVSESHTFEMSVLLSTDEWIIYSAMLTKSILPPKEILTFLNHIPKKKNISIEVECEKYKKDAAFLVKQINQMFKITDAESYLQRKVS